MDTSLTVVSASGRSILLARKRMGNLLPAHSPNHTFTNHKYHWKHCTSHIRMLQQHVQFLFHHDQSKLVIAVDDENDAVRVLVLMLPQISVPVVPGHVKRCETDILICKMSMEEEEGHWRTKVRLTLKLLNVKANSGHHVHDPGVVGLELVHDRGLSAVVEAHDQDIDLLLLQTHHCLHQTVEQAHD